jgi:hypothetical protein
MSQLYAFASAHPVVTVILAVIICDLIVKLFRQALRSVTIWINGYPPMWCDVDGMAPKPKTDKETE